MTMIAIQNFTASTSIEELNGRMVPVNCQVVGITKNDEDELEFVVIVEDNGDRWPAQRGSVGGPDGKMYFPN